MTACDDIAGEKGRHSDDGDLVLWSSIARCKGSRAGTESDWCVPTVCEDGARLGCAEHVHEEGAFRGRS